MLLTSGLANAEDQFSDIGRDEMLDCDITGRMDNV
jgi:hypothetical protein